MDMDCMVLEDVELEPDFPARFGGTGGPQHAQDASSVKGDSVSANPACLHFQTTAKTGAPSATWFHTPASTTTGSASWETEGKQLRLCEIFPGVEIEPSSFTVVEAAGGSAASESCSSPPPACKKRSVTLRGSTIPLGSQGKRTTALPPSAVPEGTEGRAELSSSSSMACDHFLGFFTFLLCGVASLCCWQFLLALMPYIEKTFFEGFPVGNSLMGVYQVGCICVQLVLMFLIESMQPWLVVAATVFDALLALVFPIVVSHGSHRVKMALVHLVALLLGVSAGMICGCCLAVASALPYNFIGAFSMGQGVAGILSFVTGLAFKEVFDLGSPKGLSGMLWVVYGSSCFVSLASAYLVLLALRQPWAARQLTRYWEAQRLRESTRRWTVMWRRWVGQPQKASCPYRDTAIHPGSRKEVLPLESTCEQEGLPVAAGTEPPEDTCAPVNFRAAGKQPRTGSSCSGLSACGCAVTYTADATSRNSTMIEARADMEGLEPALTQGKQLFQGTDPERFPVASTPDMGNSTKASADVQSRTRSDESSDDSENPVPSCLRKDSSEKLRSKDEGSEFRDENPSKKQKTAFQISSSKGATSCEQHAGSVEEEKHRPSRGWRYMLRDSGIFLVCVGLNFFVTLNLYPRVGPIMWHYPSFPKNGSQYIILFGVFCMGDFFGKCIIDISKAVRGLSWLMIPKKLLLPVVISRLGIAVFFILGAYAASHRFFTNFALYIVIMLLLAISNGWCATISLLYVCTSVERLEEREILGPASVLVLQLGIMAGAWTALAYPMP